MPTNTLEPVAQSVKRAKAMLEQTKAEGSKSFAGSAYDSSISSATLAPQPPLALTQPSPATQSSGLSSYLEYNAKNFQDNLNARAQQTAQNTESSLQNYLNSLTNSDGEATLTDEMYRETVDPTQAELNDINQQIIGEQVSLNRRLDELEKNPQGLFGGALEAERQKVVDESLERQADLSVIQMAKQGKYDSAKAIADRAISAKLERQSKVNEALRLTYEANKDLFTTAETRAFNSMLADRQREMDMEAYQQKARFDALIQQNDPMYQAQLRNIDSQIQERASAGNEYNTLNAKPQTVAQSTANGYADRLLDANKIFTSIGDKFASKFALGGILPNFLQSAERQQFEQAKRNFVNAVLRRESGAVISQSEFKNADLQYFAQPGDTPEVLAQKAQNRNTVINNFYREANTYRPVLAGDIIEADGKRYKVEADGLTLTEI